MLGNQQKQNSSQNPFVGYQTFVLNLFSNTLSSEDKDYVKGVNDTVHFRCVLLLDDEMKRNSRIMNMTGGKEYYNIPNDTSVSGYLKSVSVIQETINNKPSKKIQIVLFDPNATYHNPFESEDPNNPKNGKVVGATYIVKTAFSLKGKEMISKLSNIDKSSNEMVSISVIPARSKESNYKTPIVIKGKKIYNVFLKQGDNVIRDRFGNPTDNSYVKHDSWNEKYLSILEEHKGSNDILRVSMDNFYEKFITQYLISAINDLFLEKIKELGYELVPNGTNQDGTVKYCYSKIGSELDDLNLGQQVTSPIVTAAATSSAIEDSLYEDDGYESDDSELPF
jgi:hypothetical protein